MGDQSFDRVPSETASAVRSGTPSFQLPAGATSRGVLVIDNDSRIASADLNIFSLFSLPMGGLIGQDTYAAVDLLKQHFVESDDYAASWRVIQEDPSVVLDEVLHALSPDDRVFHRYSAPILGSDGTTVGRVEIYSDITRRRELESNVRRSYEQLKTTRDQLVQSEKLRAIGEIASGVAHDFNNTLGIILGNIQLLLRNEQDESSKVRLEAAQRAALDAVDTVRRIQEFTRTRPEEPPAALDLSALSTEVVEMMRPAWQDAANAQGRSIEAVVESTKPVFVLGNAASVREVVINIFFNAIQAMPYGGAVRVSTGSGKAMGWVKIADNGVGMTEEVKNRVFDPFFTTRGVQGTGLGMSVAYGIIRRHGGSIDIESEPGCGTTVTVTLPSADEGLARDIAGPEENAVGGEPARILVVDDEDMFAEVLVEMLSEFGHEVKIARSGPDALEQFEESEFDLVLTDLGMPEMSGWQVAKAVKDINRDTPVVLLTGWGAALAEKDLEASQVDMVLSKPVKMEDLALVVAEALGKAVQ